MSLDFYFAPNSTANVTAAVLDELEHDLPDPLAKRIELSIQKGETKAPKYLSAVNPNGRVPAIVHDGISIWESAAITMYLGETFGIDKSLYPALGPKRGEAMKWIVWTNTCLADAAGRLAAALPVGTPGAVEEGSQDTASEQEKTGSAMVEKKARDDIVRWLEILDGALKGREFLLEEGYTLADTHVWSFVSYVGILGVSLNAHANVKTWAAKIESRAALKDA